MEAEHCRRKGCDSPFSPGNYDMTTTPAAEWRVATEAEEGKRVSVGERRVVPVETLMESEIVKEAGLRREEVVALKVGCLCAIASSPWGVWCVVLHKSRIHRALEARAAVRALTRSRFSPHP